MKIPFFNYPALFAEREKEYADAITQVLKRGAYIMQSELFEFERALAGYLGVKHAIGVADGTMALLISLKASGIGHGDEVIVPSHTFVASAAAIHHAGAKPVLADCGSDHLIDPDSISQHIGPNTKAIMPVQLNGRTARMDAIKEIADNYGLFVVEDSCQALGSKYKGQFAGTFGRAGSFSFYPSKTLGCFGDGGALVTDDDEIADVALRYRDHGRDVSGDVTLWGFNSRLDNLQAAVLNVKLKYYDADIRRRRAIASMYHERLLDVGEIVLPPKPDDDGPNFDIFQNFEIEAEQRDALRQHLQKAGVGTILQWGGKTIHQFTALDVNRDLPNTEAMTRKFMLLPMNTALRDDEVDYICESIRRFYRA